MKKKKKKTNLWFTVIYRKKKLEPIFKRRAIDRLTGSPANTITIFEPSPLTALQHGASRNVFLGLLEPGLTADQL